MVVLCLDCSGIKAGIFHGCGGGDAYRRSVGIDGCQMYGECYVIVCMLV